MSTRGAWGFRIDGIDKVTYSHSDSYPEWLGLKMAEFLKTVTVEQLLKIAQNLKMVCEQVEPTQEEIDFVYKKYPELPITHVGKGTPGDWYCLLRNTQQDFETYKKGFPFMIDSEDFLAESLFCEYAYIINLDDNVLEFYVGFNKNPKANGRYASLCGDDDSGCDGNPFYGVALLGTFSLNQKGKAFTGKKPEKIVEEMMKLKVMNEGFLKAQKNKI